MFSLALSLASIGISGFAVWLSVRFYKMTSSQSKDIEKAASQIGGSVDRLESLFDKMYSDTFSMMEDTVADMRRYIYRGENGVMKKNPASLMSRA